MISIAHQIYSKYTSTCHYMLPWVDCVAQITPEISTVASSSAGILVADIHGSVHVLNRDFDSIISWIAHMGGRVTHMVERKGILVTLGVRLVASQEQSSQY